MNKKKWLVYLVRCSDNSLYCGVTNDLSRRLREHNSGKGAKYTRSRGPVEPIGVSHEMTISEALKLEHKIKRLPVDKKISELVSKENGMTIEQDLKALQKDMKAFDKKMDKLAIAIAKSEKSAIAKRSGAKSVRPKLAKKTPAKKAPVPKSKP